MKELRTEIEIETTPAKAWQILTDLQGWTAWNPFITRASGKAQVGEPVDITVHSAGKDLTLHCTVTRVEPGRELCWQYHVGLPALFRGEHSFSLEPLDGSRVRFVDCERFNGLLVPLQARDIDTNSRSGFQAMDRALKARAGSGQGK